MRSVGLSVSRREEYIGILGGSFDPIHFGHIKPCMEVASRYGIDQVRLLPCKVSPFKQQTVASDEQRWQMVKMVSSNSDVLEADRRELDRAEPSYSVLSLRELAAEAPSKRKLFWLLGMDALIGLPKWHLAAEIMQHCHVLVLRRRDYELPLDGDLRTWLEPYLTDDFEALERSLSGHIYMTDIEMIDVSSTEIREMIKKNEQPRFKMPGGIWNYIKRNQLYQNE